MDGRAVRRDLAHREPFREREGLRRRTRRHGEQGQSGKDQTDKSAHREFLQGGDETRFLWMRARLTPVSCDPPAPTSRAEMQSASTIGLRSGMAHLQHLVSLRADGRARQLLRRGTHPGADARRRQQERRRLEADLGVRLFHRSTRRLALTENGERFLQQVNAPLASLHGALAGVRTRNEDPAGTLKVSIGPGLRPPLPRAAARRPSWRAIRPCCRTGTSTTARSISSARGFDAAIGGGFALCVGRGVRASWRRVHIVAVASPAYLAGRELPARSGRPRRLDGIMRRSSPTGPRTPVDAALAPRRPSSRCRAKPRLIMSDPEAIAQAARLGLGVALLPMPFAFAPIASGELIRLLPGWYSDAGPLSLLLPEPAHGAGEDAGLRRFRRGTLSVGRLRPAGRWAAEAAARLGLQSASNSASTSAARSHCAAVTSRCVTARTVRAPKALTSTPRSRARALRVAASIAIAAGRWKTTMLVCTVARSNCTAAPAARRSAKARAFA